ncbi:MAG: chromosome partitioning protein ParB, partial [Dehalococcoidia bacterium]
VVPIVVRCNRNGGYETVGGAQRLSVLREMNMDTLPCVLVAADDTEARLLSQCLNHIAGSDDLGLKSELLRQVLEELPQSEVLKLLPETADSLSALASIGKETMAEYLQNWQRAQAARLRHLTFQLLPSQQEVVEEALNRLLPSVKDFGDGNPNARGSALFILSKHYLENHGSAS